MNIIVNVSQNWAIGKNNSLLFHISQDMKFFKSHTVGNTVIMGRKTLDSLPGGRALPNRKNIVLTHDLSFSRENVTVCHDIDELKKEIKDIDTNSVYVIGGESLYRQLLPLCDTAYVTKVKASVPDADAFMVDLDEASEWDVITPVELLNENGIEFAFLTYKRIPKN